MLCVPFFYQRGWSARIDGEAVEVSNINSGLCGIQIPSGTHEVVLQYETPYRSLGLGMTIVGPFLLALRPDDWRALKSPATRRDLLLVVIALVGVAIATYFHRLSLFLSVPVIMAAALRFGTAGAALATSTEEDFAIFPPGSPEQALLEVQRAANPLIARFISGG